MASALIVYATREGQTQKVAARIADTLERGGVSVCLVNAADRDAIDGIDPGAFDLLVFGASMHAGGLEKEMLQFVSRCAAFLERLPNSFFLVLMSAAHTDPELKRTALADARHKMNEQLDYAFDDVETIAGALAYTRYSLPVRWLMRRIASKAGESADTTRDHEYTDWQQVEDYAQRLIGKLAG